MSNLRTTHQGAGNLTTGDTPRGAQGEENRGDAFGAKRPSTAGTDRDAGWLSDALGRDVADPIVRNEELTRASLQALNLEIS